MLKKRGGGFKKWRCKILLNLMERFRSVRNKTYSQIFVIQFGNCLRKRKPAARKASKAVLINRDIALMSASWEDFRSWVLILKLVDANPFKN
jgi:hypothetical protein